MTQQASASPTVAARPPAASWWALAACRSADPDLFFPVSASGRWLKQISAAKAICAGCQVRAECLAFAIRTQQMHGIWGGMTEEERYREIVASRRARSATAPASYPGSQGPRDATAADAQTGPANPAVRGPAGAARRGAGARAGAAGPGEMIRTQAGLARLACERMTGRAFEMLLDSVEQAARLPAKPGWEQKAAAHADMFRLLARAAGSTAAGSTAAGGAAAGGAAARSTAAGGGAAGGGAAGGASAGGAAVRHSPAAGGDGGAGVMRDLMRGAGPAASGMITSSHRRLLTHLRSRDAEAASAEIESHLKALHIMWLMANWSRGTGAGPVSPAR